MSAQEQNRAKRRSPRRFRALRAICPHLFLLSLLLVYAVFGALFLEQLESTNDAAEDYDTFLNELWAIANKTHHEEGIETEAGRQDFKCDVRRKLEDFQSYWSILKINQTQWNFAGSLFFCCTVFTTVGYGHIYPLTIGGKIACMFYATLGIPIMLMVITDVGDLLAALLSKIYNQVRRPIPKNISPSPLATPSRWSSFIQCLSKSETKPATRSVTFKNGLHVTITPMSIKHVLNTQSSVKRNSERLRNVKIFEKLIVQENFIQNYCLLGRRDRSNSCPQMNVKRVGDDDFFPRLGQELEKFDVPIIIIIGVVFAYLLFGAGILKVWESWSYLDSFYFYFITVTTIGFGDFVPKEPNILVIMSILIIIGMAIMTMAFKLTQNRIAFYCSRMSLWINGDEQKKFRVI